MTHQKCSDAAILDFIRAYQAVKGYAPTKREIGDGCGIVVSAMTRRLRLLERDGYVVQERRIARSIRVVD